MKIGIDIDGVLYPWARAANEALVTKFGIDDPGEHQDWDYLERIIGRKKFAWLWEGEAAEMVFGRLDLIYPHAAEVVNRLANEHTVHFVTHRNPYRTGEVTNRWLAYWFRNYAGVTVINNRTPKWTLGKFDVFIDDKTSTVEGFLEHAPETLVLMPVRPWNANLETAEGREFLQRVGAARMFRAFDRWTSAEGLIPREVAA